MSDEDVWDRISEKERRELLIKAGILTEDLYYNIKNFPEAYKKEASKGIIQGLIPVSYKVLQNYNSHVYYIKLFNLSGHGRWYVLNGTETFPELFSIYPEFQNGFETSEDAVKQLQLYLKTTTKGE